MSAILKKFADWLDPSRVDDAKYNRDYIEMLKTAQSDTVASLDKARAAHHSTADKLADAAVALHNERLANAKLTKALKVAAKHVRNIHDEERDRLAVLSLKSKSRVAQTAVVAAVEADIELIDDALQFAEAKPVNPNDPVKVSE